MSETEQLGLYALSLIAAGLGSGFAGGLFGIGGGVLRVPIFILLFPLFGCAADQAMHMAAGTSLALAIPTGIMSARQQYKAGNLDRDFLRTWIPALVVGVVIGIVATRFVSGAALTSLFAIAMGVVGLEMVFLPKEVRFRDQLPGHPLREIIAGSIGTLATMIGVTGGAFVTPVLTLFGMSIHRTVAVAAAGSGAIAAIGSIGAIVNGWDAPGRMDRSLGYVDSVAFAIMLPTILIAAPLGVKVANRLSENRLRITFGVFLVVVSADMLRRVWSTF